MSPEYCGHSPAAVEYVPRESIQRRNDAASGRGCRNGALDATSSECCVHFRTAPPAGSEAPGGALATAGILAQPTDIDVLATPPLPLLDQPVPAAFQIRPPPGSKWQNRQSLAPKSTAGTRNSGFACSAELVASKTSVPRDHFMATAQESIPICRNPSSFRSSAVPGRKSVGRLDVFVFQGFPNPRALERFRLRYGKRRTEESRCPMRFYTSQKTLRHSRGGTGHLAGLASVARQIRFFGLGSGSGPQRLDVPVASGMGGERCP